MSLSDVLSLLPFITEKNAELLVFSFLPILKGAITYTIPLAILSFLGGMVIAMAIAIIRTIPRKKTIIKVLYYLARIYVSAIRGTPLLVQLFLIFFGLPNIGIAIDPMPAAILAFSLNVGAYASETLRSAILSIPKGQWEASYSAGMTYSQALRLTVLPQAFRVALPPLSNTFISLVKDTSLASTILITELFRVAINIAASSYEFLLIYSEAALIYWMLCFVLSLLQGRLEKYFSRYQS